MACPVTLAPARELAVAPGCVLKAIIPSKHSTAFALQFGGALSRKQRNKKVVAFKAAGESNSQETKVYLLYLCTEICEQINATIETA